MQVKLKVLFLIIRGILKYQYWIDPRIIYAQMWHETGGFKSKIFLENNNLVGMKKNSRPYDIGVNRGHAVYPSLWANVKCFFERQIQFKVFPSDIFTYLTNTQKSGYAEDKKYIERVVNVYEREKSRLNNVGILALPLVIGLPIGLYFLIKKSIKW